MFHSRIYRQVFFSLICLLMSMPVSARQQSDPESQRPVVKAVRIPSGVQIQVDGRLDETAWDAAEPITDFTQSDPQNGMPATERTEIHVMYNEDNLYIGAEFHDSDPAGILGNQMARDGFLASDDRFMWVLDPYNDQRSGYFFEINPGGAMGDAQLVAASGGGFGVAQNRAWDGIWIARVRTHDQGWTVEVEIPFRTLNFNPDAEAWGANFQRTVRRKNEESFWTGWVRNQGLFNLTVAGRIEGVQDVSQGRGLDIKPYLIGTYRDAPAAGVASNYKVNGGLDIFYKVTPQLKANLTINTDFAQTEVDDRQVNLTRFPLFFPEKRDFFLDGAGNFDFSREPNGEFNAFFSRRIGLNANGLPQKIDYGAKMTGQAGGFDMGFLQVRTGQQAGAAAEDFTVLRPKRRLFRQSYAGLIYTRRGTQGSSVPLRQTIGGDFELATAQFRGSQNLQFSGFFMKTPSAAKPGDNATYGLRISYPNDLWNARMSFREVQQNVDPAIGFLNRTRYRRLNPVVRFGPRPKSVPGIRQIAFETWAEYLTDISGAWIGRAYRFTVLDLNLQSQDSIQIQISPAYERLERDFTISQGITLPKDGEYQYTRYSFTANTANRRAISGSANATLGTFYSGDRRDLSATLNLRPRPGVAATFTGNFNRVELPEGDFSTKVLRAVISTQFSPFVSVSNNIQYDTISRNLGWQARFRWIVKPGNDVHLVFMNNWVDNPLSGLETQDRSLATKFVYTARF